MRHYRILMLKLAKSMVKNVLFYLIGHLHVSPVRYVDIHDMTWICIEWHAAINGSKHKGENTYAYTYARQPHFKQR